MFEDFWITINEWPLIQVSQIVSAREHHLQCRALNLGKRLLIELHSLTPYVELDHIITETVVLWHCGFDIILF